MNVKKPDNQFENNRRHPVLESLFMHPAETVQILKKAVNEGVIDADELENALKPFVEQAKHVREKEEQKLNSHFEIKEEIIKTHLFAKLVNFTGDIKSLKELLTGFCEANKLLLEPKPGVAIEIEPDKFIKIDWFSKDGSLGLQVKHDKITIYSKVGRNWVPFNPK